MADFHEGIGRCRVNPCQEMIASLRFRPLGSGYPCAQERLAPRKMHALPILNVAAVGAVKGGAFSDVRIVAGPVADRPLRLRDVEAFLEGRPTEAAVAREAGALAAQLAIRVAARCGARPSAGNIWWGCWCAGPSSASPARRKAARGGAMPMLNMAVSEESIVQGGRSETGRLSQYGIPTSADMPREPESVLVEVPDPNGPFGATGLGEHPTLPTAPAILNAIHDATGAWADQVPATPERVWGAMGGRP